MSAAAAVPALDVVDWRRRVFALYAEVRAAATPEAGHAAWRRSRDDLFAHHPASPLLDEDRSSFTGLDIAPYDPAWRFEVEIQPADPTPWEVQTGTDGVVPFERLGTLTLPGLGTLDLWRLATYGGGLFLPLRDGSSGEPDGSYGGGRYLLDTVKGADLGGTPDHLVVDLNFAYAPSCAYDPAWACPLAPAGNRVEAVVPVGERQLIG
ncbi:hypothetical protein ASC77_16310 [Nocardioides sp. Root1257]|uniref:DUF1684 domain-containing protein n=1 Tax=unclassified Nocardioides TaxID=2615069 RepID=UPI0006F3B56C|nr:MULTISPECIES: DUF1684 domain-containing protein [unclassified Nocardioides]KQW47963.1 hypothetical protein ASC77_16310 [Nocardioides sp. Root1257]KRC45215.1 hypothetical protein ASE24_17260 [Nocardioides sp. Root224]